VEVSIMGKKVGNEKIKREDGYLYYVGKDGAVWAAPMKHNKKGKKRRLARRKSPRSPATCITSERTDSSTRQNSRTLRFLRSMTIFCLGLLPLTIF